MHYEYKPGTPEYERYMERQGRTGNLPVTEEEFKEMLHKEQLQGIEFEVCTTLSKGCNCIYKTNGTCPFGLKLNEFSKVDDSSREKIEKAQHIVDNARLPERKAGMPLIKSEDSMYMCRGSVKLYLPR